MRREMFWLALTLGTTLLYWVPYILNRMAVRGMMPAMANPSPTAKPQSPWAERAKAAHANAVENLVVFAPAALAVVMLNVGDDKTVFACAMYFWARLAYFVIYTAGIPMLRTLSFFAGWVASCMLVARLLGWM
jgi:uncharacterized MAPEG superfamily protein